MSELCIGRNKTEYAWQAGAHESHKTVIDSSQHTSTITCTATPRVWHFSAFHFKSLNSIKCCTHTCGLQNLKIFYLIQNSVISCRIYVFCYLIRAFNPVPCDPSPCEHTSTLIQNAAHTGVAYKTSRYLLDSKLCYIMQKICVLLSDWSSQSYP